MWLFPISRAQFQIICLKLHNWGLFIMYTNFQSKKCWLFHFEGAMIDHHVERNRHRGIEPVNHHTELITDQKTVDMFVEKLRHRRGIGRKNRNWFSALARREFRRCNPFNPARGAHRRPP